MLDKNIKKRLLKEKWGDADWKLRFLSKYWHTRFYIYWPLICQFVLFQDFPENDFFGNQKLSPCKKIKD